MNTFLSFLKKTSTIFCFMVFSALCISISSCKNDSKASEVSTAETETSVSPPEAKVIKSASKEIKKIRLNLQSLNESNVVAKGVFSDQAGAVALLASINGTPQTSYNATIMELKSVTSKELNASNLKQWTPNGDKSVGSISSVITDENGRIAMSHSSSSWCIDCGDAAKNIKGKVLVISEQTTNSSKIVAATIIE